MCKKKQIVDFIKSIYPEKALIPLHAPVFFGNEKNYLNDCIDTTYVSYVGEYVSKFENMIADFLEVKHAVATVNGTTALQIALKMAGVESGDEVLTQALTFVATPNAIKHAGGEPIFIDSETSHLGMDPQKLNEFLVKNVEIMSKKKVINKITGRRVAACLPVHIFGHPARIKELVEICRPWRIPVIEDAAESIGSTYLGKHMGTFGMAGVLSFNGNKIITTGGGGMIVTNDSLFAKKARHITTTSKVPHPWEFFHDEVGYNYRLTNVNSAIGCAQMEKIELYLSAKRNLAKKYAEFFNNIGIKYFWEQKYCHSNFWLNTIFLENRKERDEFLKYANENGVMARPAWTLMNKLPMYEKCLSTNLENSRWLEDRLVNIPSSIHTLKKNSESQLSD